MDPTTAPNRTSSTQHHSDSEDVVPSSKSRTKKDVSNLILFRNSKLGQSAPSLSVSMKDLRLSGTVCGNVVSQQQRKTSRTQQRKSFVSNTSPTFPRCHSPMTSSPVDSPKILHSNRHFPFIPIRRPFTHLSTECKDGRRWSVASLPSSGYDTNSGSSNVSSQCSSQERLHHLPNVPTSDELQMLTEHFSSNESNPSADDESTRKSFMRPRSRSLSSPSRSPCPDSDIVTMNMLYKERFPNAMSQMEQRLSKFIEGNQAALAENLKNSSPDATPIIRFVHHQVLEMARDCLKTCQEKLITRSYFYEISENLEKLLVETKEKSPEGAVVLSGVIKKLLLIISRPARLLECLEFDPEEFYLFLEEAEGLAKCNQDIKGDIPRYIINKLGINKDPIKELESDLPEETDTKKEEAAVRLELGVPDKDTFAKKLPNEEDFQVIKLISNGAYGSVYLVRHVETRQRFALKKIIKHSVMLRNQIEQVFAERDIMSFTDNPFVVSMYCSFETKKYLCLVMEYVEGGDCASLLKTIGPLPPDIAKFYFAETVLAVEYLHSYGIVHRDLKPDNLLINAFGHIKLTDFGLSKMGLMSLATHLYEVYVDKDTKQFDDKQVYGTPEYIAPEVILRQGYGKPVDWWSMGIILYEFLIGCVPFFGETPEELFAHTVNDDIEWPDEKDWPIKTEAKDLISSLLQQNPRDRLGTGGAHEVKEHRYFENLDWDSLLRQKAEFVPQLSGEEDTSYFDSRLDRYKHEIMEETDENDEQFSVGSFSSCSAQYRKVTSRLSVYSNSSESTKSDRKSSLFEDQSDLLISESCGVHLLDTSDIEPINEESTTGSIISAITPKTHKYGTTPESSSQTESDVSPQIQRKKAYISRGSVPKFSISMEDDSNAVYSTSASMSDFHRDLFPDKKERLKKQGLHLTMDNQLSSAAAVSTPTRHKSRSISKSSSATGLSLFIPSEGSNPAIQSPGGSSTASSRDTSPCQELSPLISSLKPPIVIRRGPSGFGFTVHTVRVYYGDTDYYTMHHLVMAVDVGSPAFEAGLRPGDLITHINGEIVQGLYHTQVLQLLLSGADKVTLRATPLENTSIRNDGKKRHPGQGKLASRKSSNYKHRRCKKDLAGAGSDTRKQRSNAKPNLLSRINHAKRQASAAIEIKPPGGIPSSPTQIVPPSYMRSLSVQDTVPETPPIITASCCSSPLIRPSSGGSSTISPNTTVVSTLSPDLSIGTPPEYSSNSSSSSSSNSPSITPSNSCYQRPSSLHGLKHKLAPSNKNLHSPNRRKSIGHIPLSPLARTPSPSPLPSSPTRSPSPLIFPPGHHPPGSSNTTQSYSPSTSGSSIVCTPTTTSKKAFGRPKNSEPRSPLLRRALSPDRLHPRSNEVKNNFISPLCDSALKVTLHAPRITITSKSPPQSLKSTAAATVAKLTTVSTINEGNHKVTIASVSTSTSTSVVKESKLKDVKTDPIESAGLDTIPTSTAHQGELPHILEEKESQECLPVVSSSTTSPSSSSSKTIKSFHHSANSKKKD
ncbi:microtubule-associated serine/threonine-protein kinase 3 [Planococcus citri]|uniref:microtubule-associated serine/threonine-protein kinase 3 n=1 Tax=Planococcus citri TaxID=170843 RepID=UPI0031F7E3C8